MIIIDNRWYIRSHHRWPYLGALHKLDLFVVSAHPRWWHISTDVSMLMTTAIAISGHERWSTISAAVSADYLIGSSDISADHHWWPLTVPSVLISAGDRGWRYQRSSAQTKYQRWFIGAYDCWWRHQRSSALISALDNISGRQHW